MKTKMKITIIPIILLLTLFAVTGCDSFTKELTNSKVEKAFKKMKGLKDGSVSVNGIRAGQNFGGVTAVDVTLTNFKWFDNNGPVRRYDGHAVAAFTGYTDGRWTLKNVELTEERAANGSNPHFDVNEDSN